jgi:hypothetical protein
MDCFPPDLIRGSLAMTTRVGLIENRFSGGAMANSALMIDQREIGWSFSSSSGVP